MTKTFEHLIALSIVVMVSYYIAEAFRVEPIYDTLLKRQLKDKNLLSPVERELGNYSIFEYTMTEGIEIVGKRLREINFPKHVIILSIERDGYEFVPNADDRILLADKLTILENAKDALDLEKFLKNE